MVRKLALVRPLKVRGREKRSRLREFLDRSTGSPISATYGIISYVVAAVLFIVLMERITIPQYIILNLIK